MLCSGLKGVDAGVITVTRGFTSKPLGTHRTNCCPVSIEHKEHIVRTVALCPKDTGQQFARCVPCMPCEVLLCL
ncbi:jg16177 [Pararge aegeria aegeria]|uniref:Jg16177 protein n=1 Tax=Pararge aegeria aegeria TaxID=348720 RepID=A0A8S4RCW7_9NEOP|nr:jg16177 [Pararge aegeria aegeria]